MQFCSPDLEITDIKANMAEVVQESGVLIDDHDREEMSKNILRKYLWKKNQQQNNNVLNRNNQQQKE